MSTRRRYTTKDRAHAAGIGIVEGVTEAERPTGIPKETIQYWVNKQEFAHLRTTAREMVADEFWVGVQVGIEEVIKGLRSDAPLKEKAVAFGVIYDRHALLTGGATGRTESRDITGTLSDADVIAHLREADAITAGGRASLPPEDETTG